MYQRIISVLLFIVLLGFCSASTWAFDDSHWPQWSDKPSDPEVRAYLEMLEKETSGRFINKFRSLLAAESSRVSDEQLREVYAGAKVDLLQIFFERFTSSISQPSVASGNYVMKIKLRENSDSEGGDGSIVLTGQDMKVRHCTLARLTLKEANPWVTKEIFLDSLVNQARVEEKKTGFEPRTAEQRTNMMTVIKTWVACATSSGR